MRTRRLNRARCAARRPKELVHLVSVTGAPLRLAARLDRLSEQGLSTLVTAGQLSRVRTQQVFWAQLPGDAERIVRLIGVARPGRGERVGCLQWRYCAGDGCALLDSATGSELLRTGPNESRHTRGEP